MSDSGLCRVSRSWPPAAHENHHDMNTNPAHTPSASPGSERQPANPLLAMALNVAARASQGQPVRPASATVTTGRRARGQQVRLRLGQHAATQLRELPARVRSEVVTLTVNAALAGVPVAQLVGYRQQLVNLGNLINQSLRASRGRVADVVAVERAADVISKLIQR